MTTKSLHFVRTTMPESRKADFHLSTLDGSVFIDFNKLHKESIALVRISFDGYGCCELKEPTNYLSPELSRQFLNELSNEKLNQEAITFLVRAIIKTNKEQIWAEALEEYGL